MRNVIAAVCLWLPILGSAGASAQAVGSEVALREIQDRNELIAAQEALLNVYRCRFDIDTEEVPGGCAYGQPALPAEVPQQFEEIPSAEGIAARDALIAEQEVLLNVYRCRFDIDTELVPGGCGSDAQPGAGGGDPAVQPNWHDFEGYGRDHPRLQRPWQEGTYTEAVSSQSLPNGVVPELRVACFDPVYSEEPQIRVYVAWNWFFTSTISTYDLEVDTSDGQKVAFESINSTSNVASFLLHEDDITRFSNLLISLEGEQITVVLFIPSGGYTVSAAFDLSESSAAIQPVIEECTSGE